MVQINPVKANEFLRYGDLAFKTTVKPFTASIKFRYAEMTSITEPETYRTKF